MRVKFGLEFRIVASELMRDLRRRRGIHVNPWTYFPRLKSELPKDDYGNNRFPKRTLEALDVDYPAEEKRIHDALKQYTGMASVELEQFERNVDALRRRVQEIPEEIEKESAEIETRFAEPQPRKFPVAVKSLVPEKLALVWPRCIWARCRGGSSGR
jgi:hypothetical protein